MTNVHCSLYKARLVNKCLTIFTTDTFICNFKSYNINMIIPIKHLIIKHILLHHDLLGCTVATQGLIGQCLHRSVTGFKNNEFLTLDESDRYYEK